MVQLVTGTVHVAAGTYIESIHHSRNVIVTISDDVYIYGGYSLDSGVVHALPTGSFSIEGDFIQSGGSATMDGGLSIGGDISLGAGTFNAPPGAAFSLGGNFTQSGGSFVHRNATLLLANAGTPAIKATDPLFSLRIEETVPTAYWPLDEGAGPLAVDASDGNHPGTLRSNSGSVTWSTDVPMVTFDNPRSMQFNGASWAEVATDIPETDVAVSLWFKTTCTNCGIFSVGAGNLGTTGHDRHIYLDSSGNVCTRVYNNEVICTSGTSASNDAWHHVVHTLGSAAYGQRIYVDGALRASGSKRASSFNWQDRLHIGFSNDAAAPYFTGLIDDVRLYTRVLNATEVAALASGTHLVHARLAGPLSLAGNLVINASGLDASASSYGLQVAGDWRNSKGFFVARNGTVTLNGDNQTIDGNTTFYNLAKLIDPAASTATLTFGATTLQTIKNSVTLQGAEAAKRLALRSGTTGQRWQIDPRGSRIFGYVDVQDSRNINATTIDARSTGNADSGNTMGWDFDGNDQPYFSSPLGNKSVNEQALLTFIATAADPDMPANTLTFSLEAGAPAGVAIDQTTGVFTWTPTETQGPGTYPINVRVTDNDPTPRYFSETLVVTVAEVNEAPILASIGNKTVNEDTLLSFAATAGDPDAPVNTLTFSLDAGAPTGAAINATTGVFTWTPTEVQSPSTASVTIRVRDNGVAPLDDSEALQITVVEVDDPPVNTVPAAQELLPGVPLTFVSSGGNGIAVTDLDSGADLLLIALRVETGVAGNEGTLALSTTAGLVTCAGNGTSNITFSGTGANVNTALNGAIYTPVVGYSGNVTLTITTNDQALPATGGPLTDTDTVIIRIGAPLAVWVDDNFTSTTTGWNYDHFASVQDGINVVALGTVADPGQVNVAAGTYIDSVNLNRAVVVNVGGDIRVTGDFTMTDGTWNAPAAGRFTLGGKFEQSGGSFKHRLGTLVLRDVGTRTIKTIDPFYHLRIEEKGPRMPAGAPPIGYWMFDESSGTSALDSSGANHGTISAAAMRSTNVPPVAFGNARSLQFNGTSSLVQVFPMDVPETNAAVSLWFTTLCTNCGIFSVAAGNLGATGHDRHIYLSGGNVCTRIYNSEVLCTSAGGVSDGAWHHLVHTFGAAASGQKIYIDGTLRASDTKATSDFNGQDRFYIGYSNDAGARYFAGLIDDVRLYNRVLTAADVTSLAAGTTSSHVTLGTPLHIDGNLEVAISELDVSASNYTITLAGDWLNQSGTFTPGSGIVVLDGTDQRMGGVTTFSQLTKTPSAAATLTFEAGALQTVTGSLTLQGSAGNVLNLRSSAPGQHWRIDSQASRTLAYLDVRDSQNANATPIDVKSKGCIDSNNNQGWDFDGNDRPFFPVAIGNKIVDEQTTLTFAANARDPDRPVDTLSFSLGTDAPAAAAIDSATGVFTWTPTEAQGPAIYPVTVRATDNSAGALSTSRQSPSPSAKSTLPRCWRPWATRRSVKTPC